MILDITNLEPSRLLSLFLVGLLGAGHCIGMCGGIAAALGGNSKQLPLLFGYNLGRIASYTAIGLFAGLIGSFAESYLSLGFSLRVIAGVLLVLMGLYIADIWKVLTWLERGGQKIWKGIQPLVVKVGPADSFGKSLWLGALWGWLPCGLVYSVLGYSVAAGSSVDGAISMLAFGLGTLPAMFAGIWFSSALGQWLQRKSIRQVMGAILIGMGLWSIWVVHQHSNHGHDAGHHGAEAVNQAEGAIHHHH